MKEKYIIIALFLSYSCFTQEVKKDTLVFYDGCTRKQIKPTYHISTIPGSNVKFISIFKEGEGNEWIPKYERQLTKDNDTIYIPKILLAVGKEAHSMEWVFMNCDKICNGVETEFYNNGNKMKEGKFKNGKPIEMKQFRPNGKIHTQIFYKDLTYNHSRINCYDNNEELIYYQLFEYNNDKSTIRFYDKNNKLTKTQTQNYYYIE